MTRKNKNSSVVYREKEQKIEHKKMSGRNYNSEDCELYYESNIHFFTPHLLQNERR